MEIDGFILSKSELSRAAILSQPGLTEKTNAELGDSDIIILPGRLEYEPNSAFRDETVLFIKLARQELKDAKIGVAADQNEVKIEELRSSEIWIPLFFVGVEIIQSIGVDVIAESIVGIVERIAVRADNATKVHFEMTIDNGPGAKADKIKYDGPVKGMKKLPKIIRELKSK